MSAEYPVTLKDMDLALRFEERGTSIERLSPEESHLFERLKRVESAKFWSIVDRLREIAVYGRMDICAVRPYLEQYGPTAAAPRKIHLRMLQQLCHYLKSGPPYRLHFMHKPNAEVNASTETRWFPLPIDVFAWFYGDCPITWDALYGTSMGPGPYGFGIIGAYYAMDVGLTILHTLQELGLMPSKTWRAEVATMLYDCVVKGDNRVADEFANFYQSMAKPTRVTRRGEPFTHADPEVGELDFSRTLDQNQAELDQRSDIMKRF